MKKILLVGLLALAACGGAYILTGPEQQTAELGARDYADRDGSKFISCSGQDSDGDKYVTCSVKKADNTDVALLCSYNAKGCKLK